MERDSLDDILKRKLEDFSLRDVPSWEPLRRRMTLPDTGAAPVPSDGLRRRLRRAAAIAAVVLLSAGTGWWLWRPDRPGDFADGPEPMLSAVERTVTPRRETAGPEPLRDPVLDRLFASARKVTVVMPGSDAGLFSAKNGNGPKVASVREAGVSASPEVSGDSGAGKPSPKTEAAEDVFRGDRNTARTQFAGPFPHERNRRSGSGWSVSFYAASSARSSSAPASPVPLGGASANSCFVEGDVLEKMSAPRFEGRDMDHRFPVSVGVSVRKRLTPRLGVETGLVYSFLHSTARSDGAFSYRYDQRVHYLGIPLSLTCSVFDSRRFEAYFSGGVMAEAAVSAEATTEIYNGTAFVSSVTDRLSADGLLWSANLRAGLGVKITDDFGLYAEPGLRCRLGDADHPASLRTERRWNTDVRIGLRVSF